MSYERTHEFGGKELGGGEEVREEDEEEFGEGEEIEEVGGGGEEEEEEEKKSFPVENNTETTSESSSNKRIKEISIDRLSALPDSLLIHILTFLDMQKAARTAVLSKRWQFLWADFPTLEFQERSSDTEKIRKFVTRVHRTLVLRSVKFLEKFEVDFRYDECFASDINVWVEFAVKNKVKEINLLLESDGEDFYILPQMMFSNSSLTSLSLQACLIAPRRTIEWKSLTSLDIEEVEVSQNVLENILSGCPVLESLDLGQCWGFNCVEVNSRSLYKLSVKDWEDGNSGPLLEISAPYIKHLDISLYPIGRKLQLTNIASVVSSYIRFSELYYDASSEEVMSNAMELFENIMHVKELELGCGSFEVLSKLVANGWQLPQSRLRNLMVNASTDEHSFSGIVGLLESSPKLEELIIQTSYCEESITWDPAARGDLGCDLSHLKTVHITCFADRKGEPMLTMARILLKRATILEEMVIDVKGCAKYSSNTVLSYPRSSRKAVVVLRQ